MKIESSVREINASQETVYNSLSDFSNVDKVKDKVPPEQLQNIKVDKDCIEIEVDKIGALKLQIIERDAPKYIKATAVQSPLPVTLWIQLLPVTEQTCKMKLTLDIEANMMIAGMLKKPVTQGLEKVADILQNIPYNG